MEYTLIGFGGLAAILILLALRVPVGAALGIVPFIGIWSIVGFTGAYGTLKSVPFEFAANWSLSAIPMFLLMGSLMYHSGIARDLFDVARLWLGRLPGGLAVSANVASAGFGAACGSSLAAATTMSQICVPEMLRRGYDPGLATGTVAAAGTLAALIPPSILFVLFGIFSQTSISQLLIAGIIPGILTATAYGAMIVVRCWWNPALAPLPDVTEIHWNKKILALRRIWPVPIVVLGVIGGLYSGLVTATEAGAFGAVLAALVALAQRRLNGRVLLMSLRESVRGTAMIFFVAIGAIMLTRFLSLTGMPDIFQSLLQGVAGPAMFLLVLTVVYLLLGMILDPIGILLLTMPVFLPVAAALKIDMIWLGVIVVKNIEIGLLTPPVGLNVYAVKSAIGNSVDLWSIFRGVGWFLLSEVVVMALIYAFPQISLFLPSLM